MRQIIDLAEEARIRLKKNNLGSLTHDSARVNTLLFGVDGPPASNVYLSNL